MELYVSNSVRESVNGSSLSEMEDAVYLCFPVVEIKSFKVVQDGGNKESVLLENMVIRLQNMVF